MSFLLLHYKSINMATGYCQQTILSLELHKHYTQDQLPLAVPKSKLGTCQYFQIHLWTFQLWQGVYEMEGQLRLKDSVHIKYWKLLMYIPFLLEDDLRELSGIRYTLE